MVLKSAAQQLRGSQHGDSERNCWIDWCSQSLLWIAELGHVAPAEHGTGCSKSEAGPSKKQLPVDFHEALDAINLSTSGICCHRQSSTEAVSVRVRSLWCTAMFTKGLKQAAELASRGSPGNSLTSAAESIISSSRALASKAHASPALVPGWTRPANTRSVNTRTSEEALSPPRIQWVFLGPPGVGKGTYSTRVAVALGVAHIAAGDLVRYEMRSGSKLGKQVWALFIIVIHSISCASQHVSEGSYVSHVGSP
jgi:hypothetical protein